MMATEATSDNFVDAPIISRPAESTSQDVSSTKPEEVIEPTEHDGLTGYTAGDSGAISTEVSVNGGSDTEAAKAETSKGQLEDKGHTRSASTVKKPATFKAVSVNKTFLAAKAPTSVGTFKAGDKPVLGASLPAAPASAAGSRPRLVAKLGSGLRDSSPRSAAAANGGQGGAAPDGNAVWNKNRPAPPQEQKRISDEELKQQFGIHLATRLQSDDPGRQANWADIDDDDDDWAPESIEWTDGTKISLPQASDEPAPAPIPIPVPGETPKPQSPAPSASSTSVKLGGISGGSGRGLVLKGASEKPTLVAKPPGPPTPVKSPWAPLPPVDKAAPVPMELPVQQQQLPRFAQRDPHGFEAMPPVPAKEIAADDFSRTWREGSSTNRELFNSQSGRYEPVNDGRRAPGRGEQNSRQPALLQRPSQYEQQHLEPSAAFQTHRAGSQESPYGRRRTSSNVSGGSGALARRMSRGQDSHPPHDMLTARRGSLAAVSDSPSSSRIQSPAGNQQGQRQGPPGRQPRDSPGVNHASPASSHAQVVPQAPPGSSMEDEVEIQKKIMRDSREQARRRRVEEEEREEAAKKERIRLKLQALGPAPESKKSVKESPLAERTPTQIQARDASSSSTSPPKPPIPDASSTVQQYGLIKVHPTPAPQAADLTPAAENTRPVPSRISPPTKVPALVSVPTSPSAQDERSAQTWQSPQPIGTERFASWSGSGSQQTPERNVWGPPTNGRTLGNGTFNPDLARVPEMQATAHVVSQGPGPIGPPGQNRGQQSSRGRNQYDQQRPQPIGPPRRQNQVSLTAEQTSKHAGWLSLPETIQEQDAMARDDFARQQAPEAELGATKEVIAPVYKDTYRPVVMAEDGRRVPMRSLPPMQQRRPDYQDAQNSGYNRRPVAGEHVLPPQANMALTPPTRGSRFFPQNRDVRLEEANAFGDHRSGSLSPPPPTMGDHPAYDGDVLHPHVLFPRPTPLVRLPPAPVLAPIGPPKPTSFAAAAAAPINLPSGQNFARQQDPRAPGSMQGQPGGWQDRISSLLGRKQSPPKVHALAVDSASKSALELPSTPLSATVSLPAFELFGAGNDDGTVESKPMAEECFEEQVMGSLPAIRVPEKAPEAAWNPAPASNKRLPKQHLVQATSSESVQFRVENVSAGEAIAISLPGMETKLTAIKPRKPESRTKSNSRKPSNIRGGARHASAGQPRGGKPREPTAADAMPSSSPRGGRGRAYGTGSWNSNRHVSTPAINV